MRNHGSIHRFIAGMITVFLGLHAPSMLCAQAKPLIKVVAGYGSTDGAIAPLWFAKETKLFEKRGLDVRLVGMGTGSVSLRALIANDLEIASLSGSGLVQAALQAADTIILSAALDGFVFKVVGAPEVTSAARRRGAERHRVADGAQSGLSRAGGPRGSGTALSDGAHRHDEILYTEKRRARERIHARLHRSDPRFQAQQRSRAEGVEKIYAQRRPRGVGR